MTLSVIYHRLALVTVICFTLFLFKGADVYSESLMESEFSTAASSDDIIQPDTIIDVTYYHIDIDIDIEDESISSTVRIDFKRTEVGINEVRFNLRREFNITAVGFHATDFIRDQDFVILTIDESVPDDDIVSVSISYEGQPPLATGSAIAKGFRFDTNLDGAPAIATYCTPYLAHYWFPCKDGPTDKADSIKVDITIPQETYNGETLKGVSNGVLTNHVVADGMETFYWKHNYPITPYYILVAVSNYSIIEGSYTDSDESFELTYYVFPNNAEATDVAYLPNVIKAYKDFFGSYPFKDEGFGFTQVAQNWSIETQSNPIVGGMSLGWQKTLFHELSHSWFGNSVTNQSWNDVWLNEGFATYATALYYEYAVNRSRYLQELQALDARFNATRNLILEDDTDYGNIFHSIYFHKGAWVLHMLRGQLGDAKMLELLKSYAMNFQYGHVTTDDFIQHCETVSGMELGWFFNQWVYDIGYPEYQYDFYSDLTNSKGGVILSQVQSDTNPGWREVFEMDIELKIYFEDGTSTTQKVRNNLKNQTFEFDFDKKIVKVEVDPNMWILRGDAISHKKELISFEIPEQVNSVIDRDAKTITVTMPNGTDLSALVPEISIIDDNASISPASGVETDFSGGAVEYILSSESGLTESWMVTVLIDTSTGLPQAESSINKIYPNPSKGIFRLVANAPIDKVDIYSVNGSLVKTLLYNGNNEVSIDLSSVGKGVYFVKVYTAGGNNATHKVVVTD